jgi:hypothetical protein
MARCDWAIVCDYAFLDDNRKMCMVGVFDRIFATAVPAVHHQASFVLKLIGEPSTHTAGKRRMQGYHPRSDHRNPV